MPRLSPPDTNRMNLSLPYSNCTPGLPQSCFKRTGLLKCAACEVARYCGADHQKADRPRHKITCVPIKKYRAELQACEEGCQRLASAEGGGGDAYPSLEDARPRAWGFPRYRPLLRTKYNLMLALLDMRYGEAVEDALNQALEMLQLNRGDNQGVRSVVPGMMLRLGRDQDAYDFLKWWATKRIDYDFGDKDIPFLELQGEDALESPTAEGVNLGKVNDLAMFAMATLIKARLYLDVKMLQAQLDKHRSSTSGPVSFDTKMEWLKEDATSDVLFARRDVVEREDYKDLVAELEKQVDVLYQATAKHNRHFWPAVRRPERYSSNQLQGYVPGGHTEAEASNALRWTWYALSECPQALALLRNKRS